MSTTATATPKFSLALAGASNSSIANELAGVANVTPFSSPGAVKDALVIDGATAQIDGGTIQQVLDRGSLVGIAHPTAAHLSALRKLTGAAPGGTPDFVALKKKGRSYDFTGISSSASAAKPLTASAGSPPIAVVPPAQSRSITAALQSALSATPAGLLGDAALNFTIPQDAYGGTTSLPESSSCGFVSWPCDKVALGATQTVYCNYSVDLYVYWVNGYPNTPPYYIVIERLHGSASLGTVLVSGNANSQGFCNVFVKIKPNSITDTSGNPIPGCSLLDTSPQTTAPGSATTVTSQSFDVIGTNSQGPGSRITVTASMNSVVNYPGWGLLNLLSETYSSWGIYQSDGVSFSNQVTGNWSDGTIGSNDSLVAFPALSFGTIPFDTVTVWKVTDPSFNNLQQGCVPALFSAGFYGEVDQYAVQDHNSSGCTLKWDHVGGGVQTVPYWWNLDLNAVANRQNLPSTSS